MKFNSPDFLFLLLVPIVFLFLWRFFNKRRKVLLREQFSPENIENFGLVDEKEEFKKWIFRGAFLLAYTFFVFALSRPQWGQKQKSMLVSEHSVVFLIDLSRSMLTRDILPSRLEMVKQEIFKSLKLLGDVRVGLVVFAGSVDVISPMTSDLGAVESYVDSLGVDSVSSQGTQIRVGLEEAKALFDRSMGEESEGSKLIVLFSDGETHENESIAYTKKISKMGYKIFTVGVGTESGGFVPEAEGLSTYIRDSSGQAVVSKPNFKFLKDLASIGDGAFYYVSPIDPLGPKIKKSLDRIEGVAASRKKFVVRNEIFQIFILFGLLFIVLGISARRL